MRMRIVPSTLRGALRLPSSKSHTMRALLFGSLGNGVSRIHLPLPSPDTEAMRQALLSWQIPLEWDTISCTIQGQGGRLPPAPQHLDAGNSGQVLRFLGACAALGDRAVLCTGDSSIRLHRPIAPLLSALRQLGGKAHSLFSHDHPPCMIQGPIRPGYAFLNGQDSQPVSALLMAASFLDGTTRLIVEEPGETPWIELTLSWIRRCGGQVVHDAYREYEIRGPLCYLGFNYTVPADFSAAAFPLVAGLLCGSNILLENLDPSDIQGDKELIPLLREMGGNISPTFQVQQSTLQGREIDVNPYIDALPILAVVGCYAEGSTRLVNGAIARKKESDRIHAMYQELSKMGAQIYEEKEGLRIETSSLHGADLHAHNDHRVAMALTVAALAASSPSTLDLDCVVKSYPNFVQDFQQLGAQICPIS